MHIWRRYTNVLPFIEQVGLDELQDPLNKHTLVLAPIILYPLLHLNLVVALYFVPAEVSISPLSREPSPLQSTNKTVYNDKE